ncbi:hypothetical protein ZWY2020_026639 [Hordeum vulgare]|nr:hypothetical protein ZWY2020_026639 [Hordeum vulgare]
MGMLINDAAKCVASPSPDRSIIRFWNDMLSSVNPLASPNWLMACTRPLVRWPGLVPGHVHQVHGPRQRHGVGVRYGDAAYAHGHQHGRVGVRLAPEHGERQRGH